MKINNMFKALVLNIFILGLFYPAAGISSLSKSSQPNALKVYITEKGQDFLEGQLLNILEENGLALTYNYFPEIPIFSEPTSAEELISMSESYKDTILPILNRITRYFTNMDIQQAMFLASITELEYWAAISDFKLDIAKAQSSGEKAVEFTISALISDVGLSLSKITATDINKDTDLGTYGLNGLEVKMANDGNPIELKVGFTLSIDKQQKFVVVIKGLDLKIESTEVSASFATPEDSIIMPDIGIMVNGKLRELDKKEIGKDLEGQLSAIGNILQEKVQELLDEQGTTYLNDVIAKNLNSSFVEKNVMEVPGASPQDPKISWQLSPYSIKYLDNRLELGFSAFIEDLYRPNQKFDSLYFYPKIDPSITSFGQSADAVLAIHQEFINQIIDISFNRGYLKQMTSGETELELLKSPHLKIKNVLGENRLVLPLEFLTPAPKGNKKYFRGGKVGISTELVLDFHIPREGSTLQLVAKSVDLANVKISRIKSNPLFKWFVKKQVYKEVKNILYKEITAKSISGEPTVISDFPFPNKLFGLSIHIEEVRYEKSGFVLLYSRLSKEKDNESNEPVVSFNNN